MDFRVLVAPLESRQPFMMAPAPVPGLAVFVFQFVWDADVKNGTMSISHGNKSSSESATR